jgi:hypothetical protein
MKGRSTVSRSIMRAGNRRPSQSLVAIACLRSMSRLLHARTVCESNPRHFDSDDQSLYFSDSYETSANRIGDNGRGREHA